MTNISVKKEFLEELVDLKLKFLHAEIEKILTKWDYKDSEKFLQNTKDGTVEEAEPDAIMLRQLLKDRDELFKYKSSWNE